MRRALGLCATMLVATAADAKPTIATKVVARRPAEEGLPDRPQLSQLTARGGELRLLWWVQYTDGLTPKPEVTLDGSRLRIAIDYGGRACRCATWHQRRYETSAKELPAGQYDVEVGTARFIVELPSGNVRGAPRMTRPPVYDPTSDQPLQPPF